MNDTPNIPHTTDSEALIADLDVPQLQALRTRIDERIKELRESGQAELLAHLQTECARRGLSLRELCAATSRRKRGRPRSKQAHEQP